MTSPTTPLASEEKEEESSTEEEEEKESPKPAFLRETLSGTVRFLDFKIFRMSSISEMDLDS